MSTDVALPEFPNAVTPRGGPISQATQIEQSRATAEVFASVMAAKQDPRDEDLAGRRMQRVCEMKALADRAFYRLNRGGEAVTGPSIHLARELARCWGNINYGVFELSRDDTARTSEMLAFAWDLEANTRPSTTFIVPHKRTVKDKKTRQPTNQDITDLSQVYENNANAGARRVREMIYAVLPKWFVEAAEAICHQTLRASDVPLDRRITDAIGGFGKFNVTEDMIAAKFGRPRSKWDEQDVATLRIIYTAISRGEQTVEAEFPQAAKTVTTDDLPPANTPAKGKAKTEDKPADSDEMTEQEWAATAQEGDQS